MTSSPSSNVVAFPQPAKEKTPAPDRADWTIDDLNRQRRLLFPAIRALPFVVETNEDWNYWNDTPSGDWRADRERGTKYAEMLISALCEDEEVNDLGLDRDLELIFAGIIDDAFARRAKGGRYSRTKIPPAAAGFLEGIARFICDASDRLVAE